MSLRQRLERVRRHRGEEGAALEIALLFLAGSAIVVTALLTFASTSSNATVVTRATRGADYDADAVMQAAIATLRVSTTEGYVGSCASMASADFVPAPTLNDPARPLRVDCAPIAAPSLQRHVVLSVCPASVPAPCPGDQAVLRADVTFYDDGGVTGRALSITSWSNQ